MGFYTFYTRESLPAWTGFLCFSLQRKRPCCWFLLLKTTIFGGQISAFSAAKFSISATVQRPIFPPDFCRFSKQKWCWRHPIWMRVVQTQCSASKTINDENNKTNVDHICFGCFIRYPPANWHGQGQPAIYRWFHRVPHGDYSISCWLYPVLVGKITIKSTYSPASIQKSSTLNHYYRPPVN